MWLSLKKYVLLYCLLSLPALAYAAGEERFTLNLKSVNIHALIENIAAQTGRTFIVDPRVKATINVVSPDPLDADELYSVFLSVLEVHGFAAIQSGKVTKIVPQSIIRQSPTQQINIESPADEWVTHVIPLEHVSSKLLLPILRPLVPSHGHLVTYDANNSLIVTDRVSNIQRILDVVADIDQPNSDAIDRVQLKHTSIDDILKTVNAILTNLNKNSPQPIVIVPDERTNTLFISSGTATNRAKLNAIIRNLDIPQEFHGDTNVIYLKYAEAATVAPILQAVATKQISLGVAPETAKDGKAAASTRKNVNENFSVQHDEQTNSLIITASPNVMLNLLSVLKKLDIRRAQVLVKAIIVEITNDNLRSLGFSAARTNGDNVPTAYTNLGNGATDLANIVTNNVIGSGLSLAFGKVNGMGNDFGFLLRAIASDSYNNILSTPSLVTLDNEEASILVGQNIPIVTGQTTSANNTNPFQTITRQDIGISLKIKPQINEGNSIKMSVTQGVSSIDGTSQGESSNGIITRKRDIQTTVVVDDGQTLVLGGLIDERRVDQTQKVPVLGDIPVVGTLFRYRSSTNNKQNLMVFLHPNILRDGETASYYSNLKYNNIRTQQNEERIEHILFDNTKFSLPPIETLSQLPAPSSALDDVDDDSTQP